MTCIATFYSHFGAIRFQRRCGELGIESRLMPVPRALSSSCGTCVEYVTDDPCPAGQALPEVEQIVEVLTEGYRTLWRAEGS